MNTIINLAITTLCNLTIYPTEEVFESTRNGIIWRYTVASLLWPLLAGFIVGYRRGFLIDGF